MMARIKAEIRPRAESINRVPENHLPFCKNICNRTTSKTEAALMLAE